MPPPAPDPVSLVFRALPCGLAVGVGCQAMVTWTVRTLQLGVPPSPTVSLSSPPAVVLLAGTLGGILVAGLVCWRMLSPIANPWRQGMLSVIAGLGSFTISLVTRPIDQSFGRPGLLMLAGICGLIALLLVRRAPTLSREP